MGERKVDHAGKAERPMTPARQNNRMMDELMVLAESRGEDERSQAERRFYLHLEQAMCKYSLAQLDRAISLAVMGTIVSRSSYRLQQFIADAEAGRESSIVIEATKSKNPLYHLQVQTTGDVSPFERLGLTLRTEPIKDQESAAATG
jgi:hypothetical protein